VTRRAAACRYAHVHEPALVYRCRVLPGRAGPEPLAYLTVAPSKDGDQQAKIRRLEALGAKLMTVGGAGVDWSIVEDPEGNGFSVYTPRE